MNKAESKYFNTAKLMNQAFIETLDKKEYEYITVKEICEKAGVNRSTFYLHYENMDDLLKESLEFINQKFADFYQQEDMEELQISTQNINELNFINSKKLVPYLNYIKENTTIFKLAIKKPYLMNSKKRYNSLYENIIEPILSRFNIEETEKTYITAFYLNGIVAVICKWIEKDFNKPIEYIVELLIKYCS